MLDQWSFETTLPVGFLDELSAKLAAEQSSKQEAMEKYEKAEHACSMLELDLKNSQDEVAALRVELKTTVSKVRIGTVSCKESFARSQYSSFQVGCPKIAMRIRACTHIWWGL